MKVYILFETKSGQAGIHDVFATLEKAQQSLRNHLDLGAEELPFNRDARHDPRIVYWYEGYLDFAIFEMPVL